MSRSIRVLSVVTLTAAGLVATPLTASAAADATCTYTSAKKLVTLKLPSTDAEEGPYTIGRVPGSKRIGYDSDLVTWKRCGAATVTNTNKIKVVGTDQSEALVISLEGGPLAPGASSEKTGVSEIEVVGDLGDGTDTLTLRGGNGADRLTLHSRSSASLNSDKDADVALEGLDAWVLDGGLGADVLDGHGVPNVEAYGKEGPDRVIGSKGRDRLYGDGGATAGDGNDVIIGGAGDDSLYGGGGRDRLEGGADDDYLLGQGGNDNLSGGSGGDAFYADPGADGNDVISGGSGEDRVSYSDRSKPLRLTLDGKANDGAKGEKDLIRGDVEDLYGGSKADVLIGNGADNYLRGNDGGDVLKGMGGGDSFSPDDGNDSVFGGSGDDNLSNSPGQDRMFGEAGDDYLYAGDGNDGRDVFSGGPGVDSITFYQRTNSVTIDVTTDGGDGEAGENDFVKADFEYLTGGAGSDLIKGAGGAEVLSGQAGDDTLNGGRGPDKLYGGTGADTLVGGEGYDDLYGDADNDYLQLADGGKDYGDCGIGTDTASIDAFDTYYNCEALVA